MWKFPAGAGIENRCSSSKSSTCKTSISCYCIMSMTHNSLILSIRKLWCTITVPSSFNYSKNPLHLLGLWWDVDKLASKALCSPTSTAERESECTCTSLSRSPSSYHVAQVLLPFCSALIWISSTDVGCCGALLFLLLATPCLVLLRKVASRASFCIWRTFCQLPHFLPQEVSSLCGGDWRTFLSCSSFLCWQ